MSGNTNTNTNYSTAGIAHANTNGVSTLTDQFANMRVNDANKKPPLKNGGKKHKSKQTKLRSKKYKRKRSMKTRTRRFRR